MHNVFDQRNVNVIWVSNIDGTAMKELGETEVETGTDYDSNLWVQWLPDSKYLNLRYGNTIYTLPAD